MPSQFEIPILNTVENVVQNQPIGVYMPICSSDNAYRLQNTLLPDFSRNLKRRLSSLRRLSFCIYQSNRCKNVLCRVCSCGLLVLMSHLAWSVCLSASVGRVYYWPRSGGWIAQRGRSLISTIGLLLLLLLLLSEVLLL